MMIPQMSVEKSARKSMNFLIFPSFLNLLYSIVTEMCIWSLTPIAQARKEKSTTSSLGTSSAHSMPELKQKRSTTFMKTVHNMIMTATWAIVSITL